MQQINKKRYTVFKEVENLTQKTLTLLTHFSSFIFAYHLCFQMTNARSQINELKSSQQQIPPLLITKLALTNAMRAAYCSGGLLINVSYANNGVLNRILGKLNHYFQNARSKSKTYGFYALLKIQMSLFIAYATTLYAWDATDNYGLNTPNHKAIQWIWGIFVIVNLQVFYKDVSRTAMRSFFLQDEAPFCLVKVKGTLYKVENPNFKGRKFDEDELQTNEITTLDSIEGRHEHLDQDQSILMLIQNKIQKNQYKPIESKDGMIDNHFGLKSWLIRCGIGIALSMISLGSGVALRMLPENDKSPLVLFTKYSSLALQDLNSLYLGLIPFIQHIVIQKLLKLIAVPHVLNNGQINKKRQVFKGLSISFVSLNVTCAFYAMYRLFYDKVFDVKILRNPSISFINNHINATVNSDTTAIVEALNGSVNEWVANGFLGVGILIETFTFFNCLDSLMNSMDFFKNSPKRKAIVCQMLFCSLTTLIVAGVPLDQMAPQYFFDLISGILFTMSAKFSYNAHAEEKRKKSEREVDYLDKMNEQYQKKQHNEQEMVLISNNNSNDNLNSENLGSRDMNDDKLFGIKSSIKSRKSNISYAPTDKDRDLDDNPGIQQNRHTGKFSVLNAVHGYTAQNAV